MNVRGTPGACLAWGDAERGACFAAPVDLQIWAGERVDVAVDDGEVAMVVVADEVVATLLPGHHFVHVLRHGEEKGDVGPSELCARMRLDDGPDDWVLRRTRTLPPEGSLVFVATGPMAVREVGHRGTLELDAADGPVPVEAAGVVRLVTEDPAAFHASFLRATPDLRDADLDRVLAAIVDEGLGRALARGKGLERDAVAAATVAELQPQLRPLGLSIEALDVTRLETASDRPAPRPAADVATPAAPR